MTRDNTNLRIPGPTPCPEEVLEAMTRQMINHRGPEFKAILNRVTNRLKDLFQTNNDLFIMTSSGTGAMEASIVNTLSPNDRVLSISIGSFGDRYADIAKAFGAEVIKITAPYGEAIEPNTVKKALEDNPNVKATLITHNETSTGVTNPLEIISQIIGNYDSLLLVDAISSIGSIDLPVDKWACDVVATASQKGWMSPPGLSMISVSDKAWQSYTGARMPKFHWDFATTQSYFEKGQTPWTPAISTFYALDAGLDIMETEGQANIFKRHASVTNRVRDGVKDLGLSLLAADDVASKTVTAVNAPAGIDLPIMIKTLREDYDTIVAGGPGTLAGKIFRIGHLGHVTESDIDNVLESLGKVLSKMGYKG